MENSAVKTTVSPFTLDVLTGRGVERDPGQRGPKFLS